MLAIIISSIIFGLVPSVQALVLKSGCSALACITAVSLAASCFAGGSCLIRKTPVRINKKAGLVSIAAGLSLFFTDWFLDQAYTLIPVGLVTMIHFTYPALVWLITIFFFRAKVKLPIVLAAVLSAAGLSCITGFSFSAGSAGIFAALASALAYAIYMLIADRPAIATISEPSFSLILHLTASVCGLAIIFLTGDSLPKPSIWIILAAFMLFFGTYLVNGGIKKIGPAAAAFSSIIEPVTSLAFSALLFHYELAPLSILGSALILISLIPIAISEKAR